MVPTLHLRFHRAPCIGTAPGYSGPLRACVAPCAMMLPVFRGRCKGRSLTCRIVFGKYVSLQAIQRFTTCRGHIKAQIAMCIDLVSCYVARIERVVATFSTDWLGDSSDCFVKFSSFVCFVDQADSRIGVSDRLMTARRAAWFWIRSAPAQEVTDRTEPDAERAPQTHLASAW